MRKQLTMVTITKQLEIEKIRSFNLAKGDFNLWMNILKEGRKDLTWWFLNAGTGVQKIETKTLNRALITDASNQGWGAVLEGNKAQ